MPKNKPKIVIVFDLDETLGSFVNLAMMKDVIEFCENHELSQTEFNNLIDANPDYLRPGIIELLQYIVKQRNEKKCDGIMIYTNNQGPKEWAEMISEYFSFKIGCKVFDQIIAAFKINGKKIEPGRTSHDKSYDDFINCTRLPRDTQVCFIDDVEHPQMIHDNVYYIEVKPYENKIPVIIALSNYYKDEIKRQSCLEKIKNSGNISSNLLNRVSKTKEEQEIDIIIGKYIYQNIHDFFKSHSKTSQSNIHNKGKITRRRRNNHRRKTEKK